MITSLPTQDQDQLCLSVADQEFIEGGAQLVCAQKF